MSSGIVESSQSGQSGSEQQQNQPISRTRLVQRLLAASANLPNFIHDLILTQAQLVAGTEAAAFLCEPVQEQDGKKSFNLKPAAHIRPDESDADTRAQALQAFQEIMKPCIQQGKDGAIQIEGSGDGSESQYCLITLLRSEGNVVAASAVITRARDLERAQQRLTSMQLVAGYFELFTLRRREEQSRSIAQSHQHVLQLSTAVATAEGFDSAGMNLCNELAARTGAARVSLGWLKGNHIKLRALSHTEEFDKKQELSVQLVKVMEEALDNDEIVQYEPDGTSTNTVTREAQVLSRAQGGETILSLPLRRQGEVVGVVTLEFAANQKIGPQAATGLAVAVELLAPQLYDRYQNDRWLITKTGLSIQELGKKITGPKHMLAKAVIVTVLAGLVFICQGWWMPTYRVAAPFKFMPIERRMFSAPFDGAMLQNVHVLPRDQVKAGQLLVEFDSSELEHKKNELEFKVNAARAKMNSYGAATVDQSKTAERNQAMWEMKEAEAAAANVAIQIEKTKIKAPFDGEILEAGELRNQIGKVFKQGEELMVMADRNALKAELQVAERDIQDVREGAKGHLTTLSQPSEKFPFTVARIVPMGMPQESSNVFTVHVDLEKISPEWRPGLGGEARIDVGPRRIIWIWTHKFVDWVRLQLWI